MLRRTLTVTAVTATVTAVLVGISATAGDARAAPPARSAAVPASRPVRPDEAGWQRIKAAARLRNMGMAPHRTAHFRVVAGSLGLSELAAVQPLAPGRCLTALTDLYGNLLDLQNAVPGENFAPLRRFVAREPSIRACAPRRAT
jgi:hypothetical protein